jgi:hypothetical protein
MNDTLNNVIENLEAQLKEADSYIKFYKTRLVEFEQKATELYRTIAELKQIKEVS